MIYIVVISNAELHINNNNNNNNKNKETKKLTKKNYQILPAIIKQLILVLLFTLFWAFLHFFSFLIFVFMKKNATTEKIYCHDMKWDTGASSQWEPCIYHCSTGSKLKPFFSEPI